MAGVVGFGPARAFAFGLLAAVLAGCASVPAPVVSGRVDPEIGGPPPPFDAEARPRVTDATARLQCVPFARTASGIEIYGNANTWWLQAAGRYPRSSTPAPGSVFVMRGYRTDTRGHVAVVTHVDSARMIRVNQANWLNNGEISEAVPVLDVSPNNDWSEVRVWYIPGGHWGGRVYRAQGFIHPFSLRGVLS